MEEVPTPTTASGSPPAQENHSPPVPPLSRKRKGSTDQAVHASVNQKPTKRRAARACTMCRARKVRCDVVDGLPCGNCRWDSADCKVEESRRRKKNFANIQHSHPHALQADGVAIGSGHFAGPIPLLGGIGIGQHIEGFPVHQQYNPHPGVQIKSPHVGTGGFFAPIPMPSHTHMPIRPVGWPAGNTPALTQGLPGLAGAVGFQIQVLSIEELRLAPFIRRPKSTKNLIDLGYLKAKGANLMLGSRIQNILVRGYVEYVHPYMPLVDLREFIAGLCGEGPQVSLLLYNAIAFAGSAFVEPNEFKSAGFPSRKEARKILFTRARVLYDLDWEEDKFTVIQALLLMSYWYEDPRDEKDTWHWMGIAVSLARTIGLNQDPSQNQDLSPAQQKLHRRVWWSCYMRDHMIALGMRRPKRVEESDFHMAPLNMDDFDFGPIPHADRITLEGCKAAHDEGTQRHLAKMCIEMVNITRLIDRIIDVQYMTSSQHGVSDPTYMLHPNKTLDNLTEVKTVQEDLNTWYKALPPELAQPGPSRKLSQEDRPSFLHLTLLHLVYYAAFSALHRPFYNLNQGAQGQDVIAQQWQSRIALTVAATEVSKMVSSLLAEDLMRKMPTTAVTVILPSVIVLLLNLRFIGSVEKHATLMEQVSVCYQALWQLNEVYPAAGFAVRLVKKALEHETAKGSPPAALQQQAQLHVPPRVHPRSQNQPQTQSRLQLQLQPNLQSGAGVHPVPSPMMAVESTPPPENVPVPDQIDPSQDLSMQSNAFLPKVTSDSPPETDEGESPVSPHAPTFPLNNYHHDFRLHDGRAMAPDVWPSNGADDQSEVDMAQFIDFSGEGLGEGLGAANEFNMINHIGDQVVNWGGFESWQKKTVM